MKKITYPIFLLILLIFINGCVGYEPIFGSTNLQFEIADYSIEGNKILGNKIYSKLYSLSKSKKDDQNLRSVDLVIKVSKDKNVSTKDSTGKILQYKITLNTDVKVTDFITKLSSELIGIVKIPLFLPSTCITIAQLSFFERLRSYSGQ